MQEIGKKTYIPPSCYSLRVGTENGHSFKKLKGPIALILTHLNGEDPRDAIISKISRSPLMTDQLSIEIMQGCEDLCLMEKTKDNTLLIGDRLGGSEILGSVLDKCLLTRRFILTGTYVDACVLSMLEKIIETKKAVLPIDVYLPADSLISSQDDQPLNSGAELKKTAMNYFRLFDKDHDTAVWLNECLMAGNPQTSSIRLWFYSSTETMLGSLR